MNSAEYLRGLEDAAKMADFYSDEYFRLAGDTILLDRFLSGKDFSQEAMMASRALCHEGELISTRAHVAKDIATAIREIRQARGHP